MQWRRSRQQVRGHTHRCTQTLTQAYARLRTHTGCTDSWAVVECACCVRACVRVCVFVCLCVRALTRMCAAPQDEHQCLTPHLCCVLLAYTQSVGAAGYRKMNPFCIPFAINNMGGAMLAMDIGFMGPNYSISTACASGNYCITT